MNKKEKAMKDLIELYNINKILAYMDGIAKGQIRPPQSHRPYWKYPKRLRTKRNLAALSGSK